MAEKQKRKIIVTLNVGKAVVGEVSKSKSRRNRAKPRTNKTYQNKLSKLKSKYNRLFKSSQKSKEKGGNSPHFCDKYPDFESFLAKYNLKKVGKETETISKTTKTTTNVGGVLGSY